MKHAPVLGLGMLLCAAILFVGCKDQGKTPAKETDKSKDTAAVKDPTTPPTKGDKTDPDKAKDQKKDDHDHGDGPHGGTIFEFGKWHGEFTVDHGKQEATVYVLGADAKKAAAIKTDKLQLGIVSPKFEVELKAVPLDGEEKGTSSRFVGKHEKFGKEQEFAGTVSGVVDGKTILGDPFKEEPPKKDKK